MYNIQQEFVGLGSRRLNHGYIVGKVRQDGEDESGGEGDHNFMSEDEEIREPAKGRQLLDFVICETVSGMR